MRMLISVNIVHMRASFFLKLLYFVGVRGLPARGILSLGVMGLGPGQFEGFVFRLFFLLKVRGQLDNLLRSWTTYYGVGHLTTELDSLLRSWTAYYGVGQLTTELENHENSENI